MIRFTIERACLVGMLGLAAFSSDVAIGREKAPSAAEGFPIGTSGSVCDAQGIALGASRKSVFERKWAILCRDVDQPVGEAYVLRAGEGAATRMEAARAERLACRPEASVPLDAGRPGRTLTVRASECSDDGGLPWRSYRYRKDASFYAVEGLAAYDPALRLALRNLIQDRIVAGKLDILALGAGSGSTVAARRNVVDPATLLGQGYCSNSAGAYVEAAELFQPGEAGSTERVDAGADAGRRYEMAINRALQLSNLGEFEQAARQFAELAPIGDGDPVRSRLSRNYRAIDALNQADLEGVTLILDEAVAPLAAGLADGAGGLQIDPATAAGLNAAPTGQLAGVAGVEARLSVPERIAIIDAQADQLRATVLRLSGRPDDAEKLLAQAFARASGVREGRVLSTIRLNAQILSELALAHEARGRNAEAESSLRRALAMVEAQYPDSASVNNAAARLAGFLARHGQQADARNIYRGIVEKAAGNRDALVGMANLVRPYFDLLVAQAPSDPQALSELFLASQLVERPGAADAMEMLARGLAGGNAEASALFRQSQEVARELERTRMQIARRDTFVAAAGAPPADDDADDDLVQRRRRLLDSQAQLVNALAEYPQYRVVSNRTVSLDEMRGLLAPGEAYLKLAQLGEAFYAIYVAPDAARAWRAGGSATGIAELVGVLRATISLDLGGRQQTYPFDLDKAAELHDALLGPIAGEIASVRHLMFEPDGAMLQLPLNLLTSDSAGIAAYRRRVERDPASEFDFTGIDWLGRSTAVSTALSAATFRDARRAPPSAASHSYLGLGENLPIGPAAPSSSLRGADGPQAPGCDWPAAIWNRPISARELRDAASLFGAGQAELMTEGAFTDTAVMARGDLASYRIVHFATHGLVTAPREGCPARPALLTSFGGSGSDGLLGFNEIFGLRLDADLVILSACDTAALASVEATREVGVGTGGGQALDGLVRAFIAAGGRQIIASHWPAPDDYGATRRLFSGFFVDRGHGVADALRRAQLPLMDDPQTSHPFYWAGFAVVGDGSQTLRMR